MAGTTLGEIFNSAQAALSRAADAEPSQGPALTAATVQLGRLASALMLYPDLLGANGGRQPWGDARGELSDALKRAADRLTDSWAAPDGSDAEPGSQAGHLSHATDILTSGHELLRTHIPTATALHVGRSRWARVINSAQVSAALVNEISDQAAHAGEVADQLASRGQDNGIACDPAVLAALRIGGHWLRQCGDVPRARTGMADEMLLHAIGPTEIPGRIAPRPGEPQDVFMAGVETSAQRLTLISASLPGKARISPVISSDAWQSTARSAAVACNLSQMILRDLSWPERPRHLIPPPGALRAASLRAALASRAWKRVSSAWHDFRTDSLQSVTPAVAEADDLATRISWLAFDNPAHELPGGGPNARAVVSALHQSADSFACMAAGDLEMIAGACLADRVYRIGPNILRKSGPPLGQIKHASLTDAEPLRTAYAQAFEATEALARELDTIAITGDTQSGLLAHIRSAAPLECDVTWQNHQERAIELTIPGRGGHAPGTIEEHLRTMGVSDPALLQQADTLDRAAEELLNHAKQVRSGASGTAESRTQRRQTTPSPPRDRRQPSRKDAGRGD